jgi:predicted dehydrogenase
MSSPTRIGIVGVGSMGSQHCEYFSRSAVPDAVLTAIADVDPARLKKQKDKLGDRVQYFDSAEALLASKLVDGILIATPHYFHPPIAIKAFAAGVHVLSEKPAGVYTKQVREMNAAAAKSGLKFSMMFNQRTMPCHQKMRDVVASGELGEIRRTMYLITNWLRSQSYYDSGGWRGTWAGEGGGVLMNQCPHNLDLWPWISGLMPSEVRAYCNFGKYHHIEVEDDVTAYVKYPSGATGIFATTTGEAPGVNTFEIIGDRGRLVLDNEQLTFYRTTESVQNLINTTPKSFPVVETWKCTISTPVKEEQHRAMTENWVQAIRTDSPLLCNGVDGIKGLTICNAMLLSAWTDTTVKLPIDEDLYLEKLNEKIKNSTFKKDTKAAKTLDLSGSYTGMKA